MLSKIDSPGLRILIFVFLAASVAGSKRFGQSLLHNTAVIREHPTVMSCRIYPGSQLSQWVFTSTRSSTPSTLYSNERGVDSNFSRVDFVLSTKLTSTLRINKTQLDDAGIYQCKLIGNTSDWIADIIKESAHLIVLRQEPTCRTNFPTQISEFSIIDMNCSVEFRGYWFPVMEWRQNAADGPLITDGVNSTAVSNASVHSTLKLLANRTTDKMKYVCRTYFTKYKGIDKVEATNIPDYNYAWMSPQLNVTYGPQNVNITLSGNEFEFGDELTCSAYSNPEAMYEWKNASGSHLIHGPTLRLDEKIANQQNVTLVCIATNVISNATAQVTVYRKKSAWNRLVVLATVLSAVFLVILLIFASIIAYLVRSKKDMTSCCISTYSTNAHNASEIDHDSLNAAALQPEMDEIQPYGEFFEARNQVNENCSYEEFYCHGNEDVNSSQIIATYEEANEVNLDSLYSRVQKTSYDIEGPPVPKRKFYVGADGTEYMEIGETSSTELPSIREPISTNSMERRRIMPLVSRSRQNSPRPPITDRLIYATIDHSLKAVKQTQ